MHQNKQVRPALFVVHTRLHKEYSVFCSFKDEAERGDVLCLNAVTYVKVVSHTTLCKYSITSKSLAFNVTCI